MTVLVDLRETSLWGRLQAAWFLVVKGGFRLSNAVVEKEP